MAFKTSHDTTIGWVIGVQDDSSWNQAVCLQLGVGKYTYLRERCIFINPEGLEYHDYL